MRPVLISIAICTEEIKKQASQAYGALHPGFCSLADRFAQRRATHCDGWC
jgi:hypothetical protein